MIKGSDLSEYLEATSAEATIYRATLGISNNQRIDDVKNIILDFFASCTDKKTSFDELFKVLLKRPFGMRTGVITLFIADIIFKMEDLPIIYLNDKEVPVDVGTLNALSRNPKDYFLLVEKSTVDKTNYIRDLMSLFNEFEVYCGNFDRKNTLSKTACLIQSWYRSLPQSSVTFTDPDYEDQDIQSIIQFRKLFSNYSINPRDTLLEKLPNALRKDLTTTVEKVTEIKKNIDGHIHRQKKKAEIILRNELNLSQNDDLCQSLKTWLNNLPAEARHTILSIHTMNIISYIDQLKTHDEEDIVGFISHEITGLYIEDWGKDAEKTLQDGLHDFMNEINNIKHENKQGKKISIASEDGGVEEVYLDYDSNNISSNGQFFKNSLDELLDEYMTIVDNKEKVGILMTAIKDILN